MSKKSELDRNDFSYMSDEQFEHFRNRMLVHRLFGIVEYLETGRYVTQTHVGIFFETLTEFLELVPKTEDKAYNKRECLRILGMYSDNYFEPAEFMVRILVLIGPDEEADVSLN